MSFRFWRRIRLLPGVTLNLSKSTASLSFGPQGARYTVSPRGNRATVGATGTGLFYTVKDPFTGGSSGSGSGSGRGRRGAAGGGGQPRRVEDALDLGFFKRLFTPDEEKAFVDGMRNVHLGNEGQALQKLESAAPQVDARWMAGILRLKAKDYDRATAHLEAVLAQPAGLGQLFAKYQIVPSLELEVTDEVTAHIGPRLRGTRLALAELCQTQGRTGRARELLEAHLADAPDDIVARCALAELLLEGEPVAAGDAREVVAATASLENESPVHAALLLYRGRALRALGDAAGAVQSLTQAYRRRKDRSQALLLQIRYERALAYAALGRRSRSRSELEAILALDPEFTEAGQALAAH